MVHHSGQELILSAPKSVSIMALVAKDERLIEAHEKAVTTVLNYVERHIMYVRVQGKQYQERTDNAIIGKFTHVIARRTKDGEKDKKADLQLHTHCVIANATKCRDEV